MRQHRHKPTDLEFTGQEFTGQEFADTGPVFPRTRSQRHWRRDGPHKGPSLFLYSGSPLRHH